jgi:ABC-type phosphate/phosphonate transport system permease subunit
MNQSRWNFVRNVAIILIVLLVYTWAWKGLKIDSSILDNSLNYIQVFLVDFYPLDVFEYGDNYFELKFSLEDLFQRHIDLLEEKAIKNPFFKKSIHEHRKLIYGS